MTININCDMGESFGLYQLGDDEGIMPYITEANVACGFHGSDANHMKKTVILAKKYGVKVGAHFSLPDLQGFGRREMKMDRDELTNMIRYQIGALVGFLDHYQVPLSHLKPHGALYGMSAKQEHVAHAVADVALQYKVPVFGLAGTLHEEIYQARGLEFCPEFYADLGYDDDGWIVITREHGQKDPQEAAQRCVRAVEEGMTKSVNGKDIPVTVSSICLHSDSKNALDVASAVHQAVRAYL